MEAMYKLFFLAPSQGGTFYINVVHCCPSCLEGNYMNYGAYLI